jgi:hypothetical protein
LQQGKFENLPEPFLSQYHDFKSDKYGSEIIKTGHALLLYPMDIIRKDFKKGAEFISYLTFGYPEKDYTDLYYSIHDCVNLQRLYKNSLETLDFKNPRDQALIINLYFRWYCSVYETYRKFLVYCVVCHKFNTNQEFNDLDYYLFNIGHPEKILRSETSANRHELILKYFDGEIRHTISHSNIVLLKGEKNPNLFSIVLRQSSDDKNSSNQVLFDSFEDFVKSVDKKIMMQYQSMRFCFVLISGFLTKQYGEKYSEFVGRDISIPAITKRIMNDGAMF